MKARKDQQHVILKTCYNRKTRYLIPLLENGNVMIRKERDWMPGRLVTNYNRPRLCTVESEHSQVRRNRKDLMASLKSPPKNNLYLECDVGVTTYETSHTSTRQ